MPGERLAAVAIQASGVVLRVANGEVCERASERAVGCCLWNITHSGAGAAKQAGILSAEQSKALEIGAPVLLRDASALIWDKAAFAVPRPVWRERVD